MKKKTEQEFAFGLGRMVKGINSLLLQENQLSDSQNMIPTYQGWKQRKGSSALTTTAAIASGLRFKSLHQFRDLKGLTNVMIAHVYDASNGERVMKQSTLPPSTAAGSTWVEMYDLTASCQKVQWDTVAGCLIGANDKEFLIWRGEQHWPTGFWIYYDTNSDYTSYYDEAIDGSTSTTIPMNSFTIGDYIYVMHDQPMDEVSPDVNAANTQASSWIIADYYNGVWTMLKKASWFASTEYLDDDCDLVIGTGWDNDSSGGTATQTTYKGREVYTLDNGAAGANYGQISKDVGTLGATFAMSIMFYMSTNTGDVGHGSENFCSLDCGDGTLGFKFSYDGVYISPDGATYSKVTGSEMTVGIWNVITIVADFTTPASATCTLYINGTSIDTGIDCSDTNSTTDGDLKLKIISSTVSNMQCIYNQIIVGDTLDTTGDALVDGTISSAITLAQDGDITWTAPGDEVTTIIDGQEGYVVRFSPNRTIGANTALDALDIHTPMNTVRNIWDGIKINCTGCYRYDGTNYTDYTIYVNNTSESQYLDLSSLATTEKIYVAFPYRVRRIIFHVAADGFNDNASVIDSAKYHNQSGSATSVGDFTDTTVTASKSFSQKGYVDWNDPSAGLGVVVEKPIKIGGDDIPWYWYEFEVSAALDATTYVYYIEGIPIMDEIDQSFGCFGWKRRAWQIAPYNAENQLRYSAQNLPNTFNGPDSGYIQFGERPLKAASPFYNESLIFADTELWMLQGSDPSNFGRMRLSANVGTCAPQSVLSIETGVNVGDSIKNVTIWMFYDGFWMFDGVRIMKISSPDIDSFFDPDHDDYIAPAYLDQTYATYHHGTQCAYFSVYSGSAATTPTKVIVLHFPSLWYGIFDYATDMGTIDQVWNNKYYLVGGGFATGYQYLLDSGVTDLNASGTAVAVDAYLVTRDMFMSYSEGLRQRLVSVWTEAQEAGGLIEIDEYPDGSKTPRTIGKKDMMWYGRLFGIFQKVLKLHANQTSSKFRIRNRSTNARMNVLGFSATADKGRTDEQ